MMVADSQLFKMQIALCLLCRNTYLIIRGIIRWRIKTEYYVSEISRN